MLQRILDKVTNYACKGSAEVLKARVENHLEDVAKRDNEPGFDKDPTDGVMDFTLGKPDGARDFGKITFDPKTRAVESGESHIGQPSIAGAGKHYQKEVLPGGETRYLYSELDGNNCQVTINAAVFAPGGKVLYMDCSGELFAPKQMTNAKTPQEMKLLFPRTGHPEA